MYGRLPPEALQLLRECNVFYVGRRRKLSEVVVPKKKAEGAWEHKSSSSKVRYFTDGSYRATLPYLTLSIVIF